MNKKLYDLLLTLDTPTVCNSIEVAQGKRGFQRFTRGTVLSSVQSGEVIVGYARTAKIAGTTPPEEEPEITRERRMKYYEYMANSSEPSIVVIEDSDFPNCIGAFWGEINAKVHKGFGLSGVLTNGVMRDLGDLPEQFQIIAGSIGPSHGFVHVKEFDTKVRVFDLEVNPGDLIHADRHGAVVIPTDLLVSLGSAIIKLQESEKIILDSAASDQFDFETFKRDWEKFEVARV